MNAEFAYWLKLSDLSNKEIARRIQRRAEAQGRSYVSTGPSRIRGWLSGEQPSPDVAEIVTEVLTEACGEPLTPSDLGFTRSQRKRAQVTLSANLPALVESLDRHTRSDLFVTSPDRKTDAHTLASGDALIKPLERWIGPAPTTSKQGNDGLYRVTATDCEQIEVATHVFREWDNSSGGGLRRKPVIAQLSSTTDLLTGRFDTQAIRQRAFSATADLAQLAGWMSYDSGLHGKAQMYFTLGLDLARESNDRLQGARMLYCLARQMLEVGRPSDALDLLDLALYGTRRSSAGKVTTLLLGMRARALAQLPTPDVVECERTIELARETFARTTATDDEPSWIAFYDSAELAGVIGACHRDLARNDLQRSTQHAANAIRTTHDAITLRGEGFARSRVLDLNSLAVSYLLLGEPEEAATVANKAISLAGQVRSARILDRFRETALAAERYKRVAGLDDFRQYVSDISGDTMRERQQ